MKVVVNFHGGYLIDLSGAPLDRSHKLRKVADLAVVPSQYVAQFLIDHYQWDPEKIFVSPSGGVDLRTFKADLSALRSDIQPIKIGYVSRVSEGKGWQVYINALAKLKEKGIHFKGVMIGGGTQHDELQKRIKELSLQEDVEVIGAVSHEDLPGQLRKLDIKVFSTELYESLGLVGLEAMACGLTLFGSNIGGLSSYISHGKNGFLFEPGNATVLSELIMEYLKLPQAKRDLLASNAVETARKFDSQLVAKELYMKLQSLQ